MKDPAYRTLTIMENADEGSELIAAVPQEKETWLCPEDFQRNQDDWLNCVYCGKLRPDEE